MNAFKVGIRGKQLAFPVAAAALLSTGSFTAWDVTSVPDPVLFEPGRRFFTLIEGSRAAPRPAKLRRFTHLEHSDDFHLTLRFTPHAS